MTENSEKENQENQTSNQLDKAIDQQIISTETSTLNSTIEKENMEVHHHAHHGHEKKTWRNYFWEFFMLFLAVFCGFLAEIQVEHYIEHQREKKYMQMYMEDLRADSIRFHRIINLNKARLVKLDELITKINEVEVNDSSALILYNLNSRNLGFSNFLFNTRTLSQLKTSGGYKLIRQKEIADSLVIRDIDVEWNDGMRQRLDASWVRTREASHKIFDEYQIYSYRKATADNPKDALDSVLNSKTSIQKKLNHQFSLLTNDKKEISKYSSSVIDFQKLLNRYTDDLISYQQKCNSLMKLIKEKYRVE